MKRLIRWVLRLYPVAWRERYGLELETLIEDSRRGWLALFDVLKEAFLMRLLESWSFARLAIALGLAGILTAAVGTVLRAPGWVSKAELKVSASPGSAGDTSPARVQEQLTARLLQMENEVLSRTSLSGVILDPRLELYPEERKTQPLEDVIERMRSAVRIDMVRIPDSGVAFRISFRYPDQTKSQMALRALVTRFEDGNQIRQTTRPAFWAQGDRLYVLDPPSLPMKSELGMPAWMTEIRLLWGWLATPVVTAFFGLLVGLAGAAIGKLLNPALRYRTLAAVLGGAGLLGGTAIQLIPVRYVSTADMSLTNSGATEGSAAEERKRSVGRLSRLQNEVLSEGSLSGIIQDPRLALYSRDRRSRPMHEVVEGMRTDIRVRFVAPEGSVTPVLRVSFRYSDRFKAQSTVQALVIRLEDADLKSLPTPTAVHPWVPMNLDVTDPPGAGSPVGPNWLLVLLTGMAGGVGLAVLTRLWLKRRMTATA